MYFTKTNFIKKCKQMKAACLTEASKKSHLVILQRECIPSVIISEVLYDICIIHCNIKEITDLTVFSVGTPLCLSLLFLICPQYTEIIF